MEILTPHSASFRDPAGKIFFLGNRVIRALTDEGYLRYTAIRNSGFLDLLEETNEVVISRNIAPFNHNGFTHYLEHQPIQFISYPYEWPFSLLKEAALLHLKIQLKALDNNIVLIDASAYNIQFKGVKPVFIDILSFKSYEEGEYWTAHRQFCEQFLNPLLLSATKKIPYQDWYRGSLEGIATDVVASLLPFRSWFSIKHLAHVLLPSRAQKKSKNDSKWIAQAKQRKLPKAVYSKFLHQLYDWIVDLQLKEKSTVWQDYGSVRLYSDTQLQEKVNFVADFIQKIKPTMLWDLGCNDGEFAEIALQNGAEYVIGFDLDTGALEKAVNLARTHRLNFLPLYQQLNNLTPNQGWLSKERVSILDRAKPQAVLALAVIHHLALGNNIPLEEIINMITSIAPAGIIEFVPKTDPTAQKMLAFKGDIFPSYTVGNFEKFLEQNAIIISKLKLTDSGRILYGYRCK